MRGLSARMALASAALAAVLATVLVVLIVAIDRQRDAAQDVRGSELTTAQGRVSAARRAHASHQASRALAVGAAGLAASVLLVALFALYLARAVAAPIRRVAQAAHGLAAGDLAARVPPTRAGAEVAELGRAFNAMAASLENQRGRLEEQNTALGARREELARAVDRLEAEKARIARYGAFGRRIATQTERGELAQTIATELAELSGARAAVLYAAEEDAWPSVLAAVGVEDPVPELPQTGPAAGALAGGEPVALAAGAPGRLLTQSGAELAVPLVHAGATVGLVVLAWAGERPARTQEELADLIPPAAATLSNVIALASARRRASVIRAVLDSTPDAIALLDSEGQTVLENPPMKVVRRALVESVRAPGGGFRANVVHGSAPRVEVRDELELLGTGRTFARYAAPVRDDSGALVGRLVALREVTGERASDRLKDEFFALVSHELRTPLTSVIGYLELVLDDEEPLAEDHRRYLGIVQRNATRLLRLVGDLLFVAQVEAGTLDLDPGPVDLAAVTGEAVEAARPRAESRSIALSAEIADVGPVWGDRDRLGQVLDNLVTNALNFTPSDGEVVVRLARGDGCAVLEVEDTGAGIAPEEQGRLFERFFRADSAVRDAVPGVGLGLTIVRAIAEAHGGAVEVVSAVGEGTTFRVELPARPAA